MRKAFSHLLATISKLQIKKLNWKKFYGDVNKLQKLFTFILDENEDIRPEYISQTTGYVLFSDQHFDGNMQKAFQNTSAILSKDKFKKLEWKKFQGTTDEFRNFLSLILDSNGNPRPEYVGPTGYIAFANQHFSGDMHKAFVNTSAVLSKRTFNQFGWQVFHGGTYEFQQLRSLILDSNENPHPEYIGQTNGYPLFADRYFNGDMGKAFQNVSSSISKELFKKLKWKKFQGHINDFKELLSLVLNANEEPKSQYIGHCSGCVFFSDQHFDGNMVKAFRNTSSVLSKELFAQLKWKLFQGTTDQFQALFNYFQTHHFKDYEGEKGQRKIAQLIFNENPSQTYRNISSLREYLFQDPNAFVTLRESGWSISLK